jgi:hypothetical protein
MSVLKAPGPVDTASSGVEMTEPVVTVCIPAALTWEDEAVENERVDINKVLIDKEEETANCRRKRKRKSTSNENK